MTPPELFAGLRRRLLGRILFLTLAQAAALAAAAIATRSVFVAIHAEMGIPIVSILAVGIAGICAALSQLLFRNVAEHLGQDYAKDVRLALFEHASRSDQHDLDLRRMGYQVLRSTGDLNALKDWPGLGLPRLVQAGVLLPASTAVLVYLDPRFVWGAAGAILPTAVWAIATHRRLFEAHVLLRKRRARLAADITERLPVAPKLAALGRRQLELRSLERGAEKVIETARYRRAIYQNRMAIPEISAAVAASLTMVIGSLNGLPAATIAAALAALGLMIRPLRNIMSSSDKAAKFHAAYSSLKRALGRPMVAPRHQRIRLRRKPCTVEMFRGEEPILKLAAGHTAVVSSTAMDLVEKSLTGNAVTADFSLKLGGSDIADLTPGSLRRCVGIVTEQPLILKGSLRRALTLGLRPRPPDAKILQTAERIAQLDFISEIGGLDAKLKERGANVAAHHRLALSILRLELQQPGLVLVRSVMPEQANLAALDNATQLVQETIGTSQPVHAC